ncbi:MAG: EAL domain-containing protein [Nautiliaceae bacterium]
MKLIYDSVIKEDLNLKEVEEILIFIFKEFSFEEYVSSINTAKIIDKFLNMEKGRFGEIKVYALSSFLKIKLVKNNKEEIFLFKHHKKITKFLILYLKDAIKLKNRFSLLIDTLTSLPNRRYFFKELEDMIEEYKNKKGEFAVIFLDIKGFKFINDFYGQEAGDVVLQEVANRIKRNITSNGFLARIGADEFVIILKDFKGLDIQRYVEILIKSLEEPVWFEHFFIEISIMAGIAIFPKDGTNKDELLQAADLALNEIKFNTENKKFCFFSKKLKAQFLESKRLEKDLAEALKKNEMFILYQPKIDIHNLKIIGVEALLRWEHHIYGIIPNEKWISIMENSKYLKQIGLFVLNKAVNDISFLNFSLKTNIGVSVNVDIKELVSEYYIDVLSSLKKEKRKILTLELLERKLVKYWDELDRVVKILHSFGIKLSFDDFGTGNTTLKYLTRILPDEIKIDRVFISNIHNSKNEIITKAIIAMAKSLNIKTVAEGVETKEELEVLKKLNCDIIQGYYFAKPMKLEKLKNFIIDFERNKK